LSPLLGSGQYRIVLNWGEQPRDLDSHLWYRKNHLFYGEKKGLHAELDRDDTDGYGPETTTIHKLIPGVTYVYAIYDFSNKDRSSKELSLSDARVYIYSGASNKPVKKFGIPKKKRGNMWLVFKISGSGKIQIINDFKKCKIMDGSELKP